MKCQDLSIEENPYRTIIDYEYNTGRRIVIQNIINHEYLGWTRKDGWYMLNNQETIEINRCIEFNKHLNELPPEIFTAEYVLAKLNS